MSELKNAPAGGNGKDEYPVGTRVVLDRMEDPYAKDMEPGLTGTVVCVDDTGTVHVKWDNGRTLGVLPWIDSIHKA